MLSGDVVREIERFKYNVDLLLQGPYKSNTCSNTKKKEMLSNIDLKYKNK